MEWLLWVCGIGIGLIVLLFFLTIRVELDYCRKEADDTLNLKLSTLGGLVRFKRNIPVLKFDTDDPSLKVTEKKRQPLTSKRDKRKRRLTVGKIMQSQRQFQYWKSRIADLYRIVKSFLAKVRCEQLVWRSTIGTGDAADTGTLTGFIWAVKTTTLGWGTRYIQMETFPELAVTPDFNHPRLDTQFHCILKFRLGDAIFTGLRLFFHTKNFGLKKGANQGPYRKTANGAS